MAERKVEQTGEVAGGDAKSAPTLSVGYPHSPPWEQLSWRIACAHAVDVPASFVQSSGLAIIEEQLFETLRSGAHVRILVSDYLYITDPKALRTLVGWCELAAEEFDNERFHVRLIETAKLPTESESFHPNAWRIVEGSPVSFQSANQTAARLPVRRWALFSVEIEFRQSDAGQKVRQILSATSERASAGVESLRGLRSSADSVAFLTSVTDAD